MIVRRLEVFIFITVFLQDHVTCVMTKTHVYLQPSKRIEIPHPSPQNPNLYINDKSYRRQEVIHALNDDSTKSNDDGDDIESLGRSIDSTGAVIKEIIPKKQTQPTNEKVQTSPGTTKDIITKIKEIQDKLFKRTGSKDLESKLKQMSDMFPLPKEPITKVNIVAFHNTTGLEDKSKISDGSKRPDRRKIIPEEVVDKILEKFQQLRQEAKHMALLETKHDAEKESGAAIEPSTPIKEIKVQKPSNPYESIGPPKENTELRNRTEHNPAVRPVGIDAKLDMMSQSPPETTVSEPKNNNIEIPIGNSMSNQLNNPMSNTENNMAPNFPNTKNQMPVMFIKNGQMLVPVFGNNNNGQQGAQQQQQQSQMSVTGTGMAQLNTNPGVAMPNTPNNVIPITNPQQMMAAFMGALPNMVGNRDGNQMQMGNQGMNNMQPMYNSPSLSSYVPARAQIQEAASRCGIPGSDCPTPTQNMPAFVQQGYAPNPTDEVQNIGDGGSVGGSPSTVDLIRNILNAPGFPQLAARLMSEPRRYQEQSNEPETGEARGFNNALPSMPMGGNQNEEGMNAGVAQYNLQSPFNQAPRDDPGSLFSQPTNPSGPLMSNPYQDAQFPDRENERREQDERDNQMFGGNNVATNDISDPDPRMPQRQPQQFLPQRQPEQFLPQRQPEHFLDFGRGRPENRERQEEMGDNRVPMLPTRMSIQRGGTERTLLSGVDPGTLLDKLQGAQLKGDMLGAGEPNYLGPSKRMEPEASEPPASFGGSPDDLLEMLRHQNDKVFSKSFAQNDAKRMEDMRHHYSGGLDPSFADDIQDSPFGGQLMDVQSKQLAENNDGGGNFVSRHKVPRRQNGDISVLNDNFVQYKHGRMSMDSANIVNSFFRDPQYYRSNISQPPGAPKNRTLRKTKTRTEKAIVRASISKTLPQDNVELQVNGKKLIDKQTLRSKIVNGKLVQPNGKTFSSKGPVQIELSHGNDKRKIINILTKSRYNVTDERRRRGHIPRVILVDD